MLEQVLLALNLSYLFIFMWFLANILVFVQDGDTSEVSSKQLTCLVKELEGRIEVIFSIKCRSDKEQWVVLCVFTFLIAQDICW